MSIQFLNILSDMCDQHRLLYVSVFTDCMKKQLGLGYPYSTKRPVRLYRWHVAYVRMGVFCDVAHIYTNNLGISDNIQQTLVRLHVSGICQKTFSPGMAYITAWRQGPGKLIGITGLKLPRLKSAIQSNLCKACTHKNFKNYLLTASPCLIQVNLY